MYTNELFFRFCIFNFLFNQHIKLQSMYHGQTNRLKTKKITALHTLLWVC